uniref:Uncharacterized protein n=1 Tax=Candidatus Kentrum sp. LPFa TaxID=2126335 RepID=A0A450WII3_9GAMM|nr:MAG: hypothetical protein BECKLPF1236B_GA0070989_11038 [Candidatus Kentron sp. LPFa]
MRRLEIIIKKSFWILYNLSGARHIVEMVWIRKPNAPDYEKPPTFLLWVIGLYAALYGIAATPTTRPPWIGPKIAWTPWFRKSLPATNRPSRTSFGRSPAFSGWKRLQSPVSAGRWRAISC